MWIRGRQTKGDDDMNEPIIAKKFTPVEKNEQDEYICQVCHENVADNYDPQEHLFICEACWQLKVEDCGRGPSC